MMLLFLFIKKTIYNLNKTFSASEQSDEISKVSDIIQMIIKIVNFKNYDIVKEYLPLLDNNDINLEKIEALLDDVVDEPIKLVEELKNVWLTN